jgi:UDP-N-acetylglucosamine acyltransferase
MSASIHPTAIISPDAEVAEGVEDAAYAVIKENVKIGAGTRVMEHSVIEPYTILGENNIVGHHVILSGLPQHLLFKPCESWLEIGSGNTFREFVTIHRGLHEGDRTVIGNDCFFMATAHVGHDCRVGNNVIIANGTLLAGHVEVDDRTFISGNVAIHQFAKIGRGAMIGGIARVRKDVPPYCVIEGDGFVRGLNLVGLKRSGISSDALKQLKSAYKIVYESKLNTSAAREALQADESITAPEARTFVDFIIASKNGICPSWRSSNLKY